MAFLLPSSVFAQQFLPVKGIVNARDLGGYEVDGGMHVKTGRLIRAAHLADATNADIAYLESLPTTLVVDFRMEVDLKGKADRDVHGARYENIPVDASGNALANATEEEKRKMTGRKKFDVKKVIVFAAFNEKSKAIAREMYPTLLFDPDCQRQFARFLRLVVETENGAVLYHCTQGKDRTGIASALLLAALGASRETIVADFDATNRVYEKDVKKYSRRVKLWGGKEEEIAVVKAFLGCNTENFVKALDSIDQQYGSMEAYLKGPMGLTDDDIRVLRERYLEKTAHVEPVNADTMIAVNQVLEELKGRDVVLFVADEDEISPAEVPFPVVFTGMGKMRMFSALVKWHETLPAGRNPVILNIGSAGSAKYPIGTIVSCTRFFNGGCELVHDCIERPGDGASVFSGDYFMSTQTFSPEQVKELSQQYDLFDMEAYAVAQFCKMYDIPFYCLKAVSDNLDGNLKDWRGILADIRTQFTELLSSNEE